jgi:hypothetical protein
MMPVSGHQSAASGKRSAGSRATARAPLTRSTPSAPEARALSKSEASAASSASSKATTSLPVRETGTPRRAAIA